MSGGLVRLREILDELTLSERKVAEYILNHPDEMIGMSVAQLAQQSGGSQAAVIRLCKSLGLKGYQELMIKVAVDLQKDVGSDSYQEFHPNDTIEQIIQSVSNNNIQSIRDTAKIIDPIRIQKAVNAIIQAKRIYFYGQGASNLIAIDAQHKFLRINKTCFAFADADLQVTSSVMLTPEDVAITVSYSGETPYMIECIKRANTSGATTISLTKYGNTTISQLADIPLYSTSTENEIRSGATSSRITQLNIIDILYLGVASKQYSASLEYLEKSRDIIKKMKRL
ncbi:MurR/RpiR family transcriptional regulator [Paenibacillus albiflavus]|uniref:MurR/RpiR family transcriptional regulator n=1 Tax=Paenibacillus albiflavus TaxID=2545760 RepID=A0A4R4EGM8_9BACL|nr:MurR/RpiR family transcriptional regulator [Paenibacillus albiflavus]TCZ77411.1 MurR/RpiR family transcriptional regulator [Paenibacillus albiflavus]